MSDSPYLGRTYQWEGHPNETALMNMEIMSAPVATDWPSFKLAVFDKVFLRYKYYGHGTRLYYLNRTFHRLHNKLAFRAKDAANALITERILTNELHKNNIILFPRIEWEKFILKAMNHTPNIGDHEVYVDPIKQVLDASLER